jgi:hypothetical protein
MIDFGKFHSDIQNELEAKGFHILDKQKCQLQGNYPNSFGVFPDLTQVELNRQYVVRLFVADRTRRTDRVDSGLITVLIKKTHGDLYTGIVQTILPPDFPISTGSKLVLTIDQILYEQPAQP